VDRFLTGKIKLLVIFLLIFAVSGCGLWKDFREWWRPPMATRAAPEDLYKRGAELYQEGRYKKAIESFQRVKEQYPLHKHAIDAEIGIADSHFSDGNFIEAEMGYRDFIDMRPTNENLPYAMYQLGMCSFNQMGAIDRDQTETIKALKEFERLISRFPSSNFSFMAERHVLECRKRLAEKEFYIGSFYFTQGKYKAALSRFETIARDFPGIGLDYKVRYFIEESKKKQMRQEAEDKLKKDKADKKAKAKEDKAANKTPAGTSPPK
jgi:outer membrane protein assembly factor BamD